MHPIYNKVAGRLALLALYKATPKRFSQMIEILAEEGESIVNHIGRTDF